MRSDFAILILTHGRADRVRTADLLKRCGYDGRWYIVIDDEDKQEDEYRKRYGDRVLQFCKAEVAKRIDVGNNVVEKPGVVYARNACWELARGVGARYFMQLDDDYLGYFYRFTGELEYLGNRPIRTTFSQALEAMVGLMEQTQIASLAFSQGGDWIGGANQMHNALGLFRRKVMNSWICCTDREFDFLGLINEDVTTNMVHGRRGALFITLMQLMLGQVQTQTNAGGMSDLYWSYGTYVKSFYSVMYAPSCVKVSTLIDSSADQVKPRFHHYVKWGNACPKIVRESLRKQSA